MSKLLVHTCKSFDVFKLYLFKVICNLAYILHNLFFGGNPWFLYAYFLAIWLDNSSSYLDLKTFSCPSWWLKKGSSPKSNLPCEMNVFYWILKSQQHFESIRSTSAQLSQLENCQLINAWGEPWKLDFEISILKRWNMTCHVTIFDQIKIERRSKGGGRIQPINIQ